MLLQYLTKKYLSPHLRGNMKTSGDGVPYSYLSNAMIEPRTRRLVFTIITEDYCRKPLCVETFSPNFAFLRNYL